MKRKTKECEIELKDAKNITVNTPSSFFSHLLKTFLFYMDLKLEINVRSFDRVPHHYIEDTGFMIGKFIKNRTKSFKGINRFSWCVVPMDESCVLFSIDISKRSGFYLHNLKKIEYMNFFEGFSRGMEITIHLRPLSTGNYHHFIEACFKGFSLCLKEALKKKSKIYRSTKGIL